MIRAELVEAGEAIVYSEPERPVTSRSGDDCVVALTDQWYMTYGEADWEAATRCAPTGMCPRGPKCAVVRDLRRGRLGGRRPVRAPQHGSPGSQVCSGDACMWGVS